MEVVDISLQVPVSVDLGVDLGVIISMMVMLYASDIVGHDRRISELPSVPLHMEYDYSITEQSSSKRNQISCITYSCMSESEVQPSLCHSLGTFLVISANTAGLTRCLGCIRSCCWRTLAQLNAIDGNSSAGVTGSNLYLLMI